MELEQKIDSLADNVIALAGQTEKRAKNAEQLAVQAQRILDSSSNRLDGSAERIRQEAAEAVRSSLEQSVGKFSLSCAAAGILLLPCCACSPISCIASLRLVLARALISLTVTFIRRFCGATGSCGIVCCNETPSSLKVRPKVLL